MIPKMSKLRKEVSKDKYWVQAQKEFYKLTDRNLEIHVDLTVGNDVYYEIISIPETLNKDFILDRQEFEDELFEVLMGGLGYHNGELDYMVGVGATISRLNTHNRLSSKETAKYIKAELERRGYTDVRD